MERIDVIEYLPDEIARTDFSVSAVFGGGLRTLLGLGKCKKAAGAATERPG